jgi:AcrR family transcriptional regulator
LHLSCCHHCSGTALSADRVQCVQDAVKQPYRSRVRAEAALRTRRLIREAAARLFVEQGAAATTMRQIAAEAGVAERTVYTAFPTKGALFKEALDVATVGDEEPRSVAERPEFTSALIETDPERAIEQLVDYGTALLERSGDLMSAALESSGADPEMRQLTDDARAAMTVNMRSVAEAWHGSGMLREGLDPDEAGAILYTLAGPVVHHLLRRDQGWTAAQYTAWLRDTLLRTLMC